MSNPTAGPLTEALEDIIERILSRKRFSGWELIDIEYDGFKWKYSATFERRGVRFSVVVPAEAIEHARQSLSGLWKIKRMMKKTLIPNTED